MSSLRKGATPGTPPPTIILPRSSTNPPAVIRSPASAREDRKDIYKIKSNGEEKEGEKSSPSLSSRTGDKSKRLSRSMKRSLSNLSLKKANTINSRDSEEEVAESPKDKRKLEKERQKEEERKQKEERERQKEEEKKQKEERERQREEEKEREKQRLKEEKEKQREMQREKKDKPAKKEKKEKQNKDKPKDKDKHNKDKDKDKDENKDKKDKPAKKEKKEKNHKDKDKHKEDDEQKKQEKELRTLKKEEKRRAQMKSQLSFRGSKRKNVRIFGIPLRRVLAEHPECCIPPFVEQACLFIEQTMLNFEGIFRRTGNKEECKRWRDVINTVGYLEWGKVRENITVCDLLKLYLRELPDPLLTYELYDCFLAKAKSFRKTDMVMNLRGMVELIPPSNLRLLKRLIITLRKVREHAEKNLMDENNLGVIFGPNLLRAPADSGVDLMTDFEYVNAITLSLIVDYDALLANVKYKPYYQCHVRADQDYVPQSLGELLIRKGEVVLVTVTDKSGWWLGEIHGEIGRFPVHCCQFLDGTPCIQGYPPFDIEPCDADGSTPRESRVIDASKRDIATLRKSPRGQKSEQDNNNNNHNNDNNSHTSHTEGNSSKEELSGQEDNPGHSPDENVGTPKVKRGDELFAFG